MDSKMLSIKTAYADILDKHEKFPIRKQLIVSGKTIAIGRSSSHGSANGRVAFSDTFYLNDRTISMYHVDLFRDESSGLFYAVDLDSTHGSAVLRENSTLSILPPHSSCAIESRSIICLALNRGKDTSNFEESSVHGIDGSINVDKSRVAAILGSTKVFLTVLFSADEVYLVRLDPSKVLARVSKGKVSSLFPDNPLESSSHVDEVEDSSDSQYAQFEEEKEEDSSSPEIDFIVKNESETDLVDKMGLLGSAMTQLENIITAGDDAGSSFSDEEDRTKVSIDTESHEDTDIGESLSINGSSGGSESGKSHSEDIGLSSECEMYSNEDSSSGYELVSAPCILYDHSGTAEDGPISSSDLDPASDSDSESISGLDSESDSAESLSESAESSSVSSSSLSDSSEQEAFVISQEGDEICGSCAYCDYATSSSDEEAVSRKRHFTYDDSEDSGTNDAVNQSEPSKKFRKTEAKSGIKREVGLLVAGVALGSAITFIGLASLGSSLS